jgi:Cys-rich four helix bundle protein (predicted Tat secretion target)
MGRRRNGDRRGRARCDRWDAATRPGCACTTRPRGHDDGHGLARAAGLNDALIPAYQTCIQTAEACISHCQQRLAQGDKSLGDCLRTALETDTVCSAVLKMAGLNSRFTAAIAKQSIPVMQACVEACKEHVDHHAQCKACHDACLKAIDAAKLAV